jgi:V-type H+-transporting ATPase subunit E
MQSNQINKARLKVLQAQDGAIEEIMDEARARLASVPSATDYVSILSALMLQSFYRFMDGGESAEGLLSISVRVRQGDLAVAQRALEQAQSAFRQSTGKSLRSATIDEANWLQESSLGGIIASSMNGRIVLENTLASRLGLVGDALLPVLRTELFGASETRRFFD